MPPRDDSVLNDRFVEAQAALDDDGYCVIDGVLDGSEVARLRARLATCAAAEVEAGTAWLEEPDNQRIWMLLNKGREFIDLAVHPVALRIAKHLLGETFLLSNITANIVRPGGKAQASHADQDFIPQPWPNAVVATVLWVLDDFTEANGATRVLPGSIAADVRHDDADLSQAPAVGGVAGSLIVLDGRLWHGAGANVTAREERRAILVNYCAPYLRQQENFWRSADPELLRTADPTLLALLGDAIYDSLGMVNGLDSSWRGKAAEEFGPSWS
jgi:ectoine hydroxylase-related dioxygenase (phytanoyl-CoA dioxygenase family)